MSRDAGHNCLNASFASLSADGASLIRLRKGRRKELSACTWCLFAKKTKSLQADRLVVYQSTYSLALCLAPNLLDEGLESRPTLLAELLFETKRYKLV